MHVMKWNMAKHFFT